MASLVSVAALSHSPLMNASPPPDDAPKIAAYRAAAERLGERLKRQKPDVVLVIGQDHFRTFFYDMMPAFCMGVGRFDGWGDWGTSVGPFKTAPDFARGLARHLLGEGFEPAISYDLKVDHGITQPLDLMGMTDVPVVPVLINTSAPPLPTPARCYEFGRALARGIAASPEQLRVVVIGSGGLSHTPPFTSVESTDPADAEKVERLIHGHGFVAGDAAAREARLIAAADHYAKGINPEWDRAFMARLAEGDGAGLAGSLDEATIEAGAGCGGQEVRTWLAMAGAAGHARLEILHYEPIPFLITGMGMMAADLAA